MGNGHLDIGIGQGDAGVYNNQPAIQNFTNLLALQKQRRDAENQQLAQEFAKSSPAGIREPDRDGYMQQYQELQGLGRQKINERDPYKKAQLQAQIDKGFQDLGGYVSNSKQKSQDEHFYAQQAVTNKQFHDSLSDDAIQKMIKSRTVPMNDSNFISDYNTLQRNPDMDKFNKSIKDIHANIVGNSRWDYDPTTQKFVAPTETRGTQGNQQGTFSQSKKIIDPTLYPTQILHQYTTDRDTPVILKKMYPQIAASISDPDQLKAALVGQYIKDNPLQGETSQTKFTADQKPDDWYAHANYMDRLIRARKDADGGGGEVAPVRQLPYGDKGQFQTNAKNSLGVSLPGKNFLGSPAINMANGKPIKSLAPSSDYAIVGAGDYPVMKNMKNPELNGSLAGSKFESDPKNANGIEHKRFVQVRLKTDVGEQNFLVPYDRIPANVKNSKEVRKALAPLDRTPLYGSGGQQSPVKLSEGSLNDVH